MGSEANESSSPQTVPTATSMSAPASSSSTMAHLRVVNRGFFGSVRRSLVFKPSGVVGDHGGGAAGAFGGFVEKIGSTIPKSRIGLLKPSTPSLPPIAKPTIAKKEDVPPIWWRKGEMIGCGAFGRVYMGMNLDSGELIAVKQVSIDIAICGAAVVSSCCRRLGIGSSSSSGGCRKNKFPTLY